MLAGALAGVAAGIHDVIVYYANFDQTYQVAFGVATTVSGIVLAGIGAWWLLRALIGTGVLRDFAVGRDQRQV
jgi:energy-coupling factor transport system permease protein